MIWLLDGKTPKSLGRGGVWTRVDVCITTPGYNVLDVVGGKDTSGSNVQIYGLNNTPTQHWHLYTGGQKGTSYGGGQYYAWICIA